MCMYSPPSAPPPPAAPPAPPPPMVSPESGNTANAAGNAQGAVAAGKKGINSLTIAPAGGQANNGLNIPV